MITVEIMAMDVLAKRLINIKCTTVYINWIFFIFYLFIHVLNIFKMPWQNVQQQFPS